MKTSSFLICCATTNAIRKQLWYVCVCGLKADITLLHPPLSPQDLLYRRMRSLANFEAANKKLETAKIKKKGLAEAEVLQQTCSTKFDKLSETGKVGQ